MNRFNTYMCHVSELNRIKLGVTTGHEVSNRQISGKTAAAQPTASWEQTTLTHADDDGAPGAEAVRARDGVNASAFVWCRKTARTSGAVYRERCFERKLKFYSSKLATIPAVLDDAPLNCIVIATLTASLRMAIANRTYQATLNF
uniref:Uncharacterized protein n=1 Tax=Panagrellus redivivus TaxID=6233 RepID=A0A7E4V2V2_PANRE